MKKAPSSESRVRSSGTLLRCAFTVVLFSAATFALYAETGVDTPQQASFPEIFVVNSTGDGDDAFPGDGQCETAVGNGVCTLRAAIEETNAHPGGDGIGFSIPASDPGYSNGRWTISLTKALPNISDSVNINGPGADQLTVIGAGVFRIFNVTTSGTVNLSGLTISHGYAPSTSSGAGIQNYNAGTVNVTNCILSNNIATSLGGGISNASASGVGGTVNISNSTLSGNYAVDGGGGILNGGGGTVKVTNTSLTQNGGSGISNVGTLTITNSTLSGNYAVDGGGIHNDSSFTATVNVTNCTFIDNSASDNGGGIYTNVGTVNVSNSTFFANSTPHDGGGIYVSALNNTIVNVTNSTLTSNVANRGGGIFNAGSSPFVKSSIIAGNTAISSNPDVSGTFSSQGYNLIGKKDGSTGFTAATDKKGTIASPLNPKLDWKGLRDNGGPTQTIALLKGSPAIDKGTSNGLTGTLTTDQRGFARTVDYSGIANATGGDGTDIGAYEFGAQ